VKQQQHTGQLTPKKENVGMIKVKIETKDVEEAFNKQDVYLYIGTATYKKGLSAFKQLQPGSCGT
jgi:hypothetical protein